MMTIARKWLAVFGLVLSGSLIVLFGGCATIPPEQQLADNGYRIHISSNPSGAMVYGIINGQPGSLLGVTPLTLTYGESMDYKTVYGDSPSQTLSGNMWFDYGFPGGMRFNRSFHVILLKDGYRPYYLTHEIARNSEDNPLADAMFKRRDVYLTATLMP